MKRRFLVAISIVSLFALAAPPAAMAGNGDNKKCAPGQHGNPLPGFKPGSC